MKNIRLGLLLLICIKSVSAQDPLIPVTHKDLIIKYTADWCPPCGTVGWAITDSLVSEAKAGRLKAVVVAMHNQSYINDLNVGGNIAKLKSNLTASVVSVPSFSVGRENLGYTSALDIMTKVTAVTTSPAVANTGFFINWALDNKSVTINATTQFFSAATGLYSIGIYAYEDSVISGQEGRGPLQVHKGILRADTGGKGMITPFGTSIVGASFYAGQKIKNSFILPISANWNKKNIKFFSVVWKNNSGNWDVVNVNDIATVPTSITPFEKSDFKIGFYPNPAQDQFTVSLPSNASRCGLVLLDATGKTLCELYKDDHLVKQSAVSVARPAGLAAGLYYLQVNTDIGSQVVKILFK